MKGKTKKTIAYILVVIYGALCTFLYYKQTQWTGGAVYESDLPAHISMIVDDGWFYSLTALVYLAFYKLGSMGDILTAAFLGASSVLAIIFTSILIGESDGERNDSGVIPLMAALVLNIVMPCYVKGMSDGRYIGMQSASIWHNSTYIVMKWLAILCLIYYIRIERKIDKELKVRELVIFSVLQFFCSAVKPSFLMVFAPMMLIFMICDLVRGVKIKNLFFFGCALLPAAIPVLLQRMILFGADTGNGIILDPGAVMRNHSAHPIVAAGLSILFPLIVFVFHIKEILSKKLYLGALIMASFGFTEYFLFSESGKRALDGNFSWGYAFAILPLFAVGLRILLCDIAKNFKKKKDPAIAIPIVESAALLWHVYCGIVFFAKLVCGTSYFMWG
ncbi:MAG: hypothetical protein K6G57_02800 [Lachnospiraceae bacterium]|nr:hypothetical protein [Lachnospiraceae bacterium]